MAQDNFEKRLTGFIIHSFAVAHSLAAATLSQTVLGDEAVLTALTIAMIVCITSANGRKANVATALSYLGILAGTYLGTRGAMFLVKWVPGLGNAANAFTTFGVTELIGWYTYLIVKQGKDPNSLSDEEKKDLKEQAKQLKKQEHDSSKKLYDQMSSDDKIEVEHIMKQLRNKDLPEETVAFLTKRLSDISRKYVE